MKHKHPLQTLAATLALAFLLPAVSASAAVTLQATVDTSSLIGDPLAPFSLYFQFNDGDGTGNGNNTVTLSNFTFGAGGSATGTALSSGGGSSGDLYSSITIVDTSAFNDLYQTFTAGTILKFDITLTTTVEAGPTPDRFGFAILDSSLNNILTTDPGSQFITIDIDSPTSPTVLTYGSSQAPFTILPPTVVPLVPEPTRALLLLGGLMGVVGRRRRK